MHRQKALAIALALAAAACGQDERPAGQAAKVASPAAAPAAAPAPAADLPMGLLLAISRFEKVAGAPRPHSELLFLRRQGGRWVASSHEDPTAPVFHKALLYQPPGKAPEILTLGGSTPGGPAALKLWHKGPGGLQAETVWEVNFGGKFSRMRDAEIADLYGDGKPDIAVATHDQGVVAIIRPKDGGGFEVKEIDHQKDTFVHEIEIGDLDGDGVLEVYATPSEPNRLDGSPQTGKVVRYVPKLGEGRQVVGDLGNRHAKEILVGDVDGDGRDELYVSIEAAEGGDLEIRRYDAGTDPKDGVAIATLHDPMCRFLVAGDFDGDGKKEMVASTKDAGVWLLRPGADPKAPWEVSLIDAHSKGFEHATLAADLDGDGVDELYVASDDDKEIRRYTWSDGAFRRETIYKRSGADSVLTWNLTPVPVDLMP
jgi:FG-GAP-like repeat